MSYCPLPEGTFPSVWDQLSFLPFLLFSPTSLLSFVEIAVSSSCLKETAIFFFFFCPQGHYLLHSSKAIGIEAAVFQGLKVLTSPSGWADVSKVNCIFGSSPFNEWMVLLCHLIDTSDRCHRWNCSRNRMARESTLAHESNGMPCFYLNPDEARSLPASQQMFCLCWHSFQDSFPFSTSFDSLLLE